MATVRCYIDELPPMIDEILNGGCRKQIIIFSRMTEIEQRKIIKQQGYTYHAAKSVLEKHNKRNYLQKLYAIGADKYLTLCLAIANFNLHKNLTGVETALIREERQKIRKAKKKKRTCKDKIIDVAKEIDQLKIQGKTWTEIDAWLRSGPHRNMFTSEHLDRRYLRRVFAAWKSSIQGPA